MTTFTVTVKRDQGDWAVTVNEDDTEYAKVLCRDLDTALRMALPYMASVASDPRPPYPRAVA